MAQIPSRVRGRLADGVKKFQPVLEAMKTKDNQEADTSLVVTDILSEVFGYDRYSEITAQHEVQGTRCDLAVKVDEELKILVEVKAVGVELKDAHVKQAVDYAANQGIDWVILSNGVVWRIYKLSFKKPIEHDLVVEFSFLALKAKSDDDLDVLFLCCREAWEKSALDEYHAQREAISPFCLGAIVLSEPVLKLVRRQVRRLSPDVKSSVEEIAAAMRSGVLTPEILEGEKADEARRRVNRLEAQAAKARNEEKPAEAQKGILSIFGVGKG